MDIKKTITSIFMVPTLKIPKDKLLGNGFINGYEMDIDKDNNYSEAIYLLFKPENLSQFREFLEEEYERTKNVIEDYDYPNGFVVVVYKLDTEFRNDFKLVRRSMYSKVSNAFKLRFPQKVTIQKDGKSSEQTSLQYKVFNKTEDLQKYWEDKLGIKFGPTNEYWEGYDPEKEILTIKDIK